MEDKKELEINYDEVRNCINRLKEMQTLDELFKRPAFRGEGASIEIIDQIAGLYETFFETVIQLSKETEVYLSNFLDDLEEVDEKKRS